MLATLIQRYDKKKVISFFIQFKNERLTIYKLAGATCYDRINTIYQFIKPFSDKKKLSIFEDYGAFKK